MDSIITAQLGLLEDDIAYRLALLSVNVLQPLKDKYPNIVVVSGFRQTNSGIGQHELGEAVDLQIRNQTPALLYEVADYIQKNLNFDQLVLNFTAIGTGEPWIHVSFSPVSLRGQVLTKDFADVFHEGLFVVDPLTGEAAAAALRDQAATDAKILAELKNIQARQDRLNVKPVELGGDGSSGGEEDFGPDLDDAHFNAIKCVFDKVGPQYDAFEFTKRIAWLFRDEGAGLLIKNGGDNVSSWNGYNFAAGRICYPDGTIYKVVGDADPGNPHFARAANNGKVDPSKYVPAMNPGDGDYLTCAISAKPTP